MKVFWWQCGLHIEPESNEEHAALCLLLDTVKFTSIAADSPEELTKSVQTSSVLCQQLSEEVVTDL